MTEPRRWLIGRAPDCDLVLNGDAVSWHHCRLTLTATGFTLEDLNSSNGTFVNSIRVTSPTSVTRGDRITLGLAVPMPWPEVAAPIDRRIIRIGRAPDNDIVLDCPMVSAHHAQIILTAGQAQIEDLGSANGTAVGRRDNKIKQAPLSPKDVVFFGSLRVPATDLLGIQPQPVDRGLQPIAPLQAVTVFGRDPACDRVLDYPMISRRHVRLERSGDGFLVTDLDSANGTFINGRRIRGTARANPGDVIGLGSYLFALESEGQLKQRDQRGNVTLTARGVTVEVPDKRLIEDISLTILPHELVGLMGPSGTGKTTLLSALNGYTRPTSGEVLLNGENLYDDYGQFARFLGYVPQDDIMHRDLTVGQALYYTARLRLPPDFSNADIAARIREVLRQLGLEGTENVLIGSPEKKGISGGQRKRVNLAMELLTEPLVLFLDEPTSGLSSEDALMVMKLLRTLADGGKTILLTLHQPSLEAFRLLDNLAIVAKGQTSAEPGRLVYYGPAYPHAVQFFNPDGVPDSRPGVDPTPDDMLRGLSRRPSAEWAARYEKSTYRQDYVKSRDGRRGPTPPLAPSTPSWTFFDIRQWLTLLRRAVAIKARDAWYTTILLVQAPIIALLILLVFASQVNKEITDATGDQLVGPVGSAMFLLVLAALWFGSSNTIREIVGEWAIYRRERMVNLQIAPYVASKCALFGTVCLLQCATLLLMAWLGGIVHGAWWPMLAILWLASLVGVAVGLTISALARTSEVATTLLPLVLLPMVILAGALLPIHKVHVVVQLPCQAMPSRWAYEGLLVLESEARGTYHSPAEPTVPRDLAEHYFPKDDHRLGPGVSTVALVILLILLLTGVHLILRVRDLH